MMSCYDNLCVQARYLTSAEIHRILTPLNHKTSTSSVFSQRAHDVTKLLLLCYFHLGWMYITLIWVAAPMMSCYGNICAQARSLTSAEIHRILTPLNHKTSTSSILYQREHGVTKLLLLCYFCLGLMIWCLVSTYTSEFLDFESINAFLLSLSDISVDPGKPPHKFPALQHLFRQHIPFKASFRSAREFMLFRNRYNNHRSSDP